MKQLLMMVCVTLCLSGCAGLFSPDPFATASYDVYISDQFPKEVRETIKVSVNEWQKKLPGFIKLTFRDGWENCLRVSNSICFQPVSADVIQGRAGLTSSNDNEHSALIQIATQNYVDEVIQTPQGKTVQKVGNWQECVSITSAHEFGHALGLPHGADGSIMAESGDKVSRKGITGMDVAAFFRMRGLLK